MSSKRDGCTGAAVATGVPRLRTAVRVVLELHQLRLGGSAPHSAALRAACNVGALLFR